MPVLEETISDKSTSTLVNSSCAPRPKRPALRERLSRPWLPAMLRGAGVGAALLCTGILALSLAAAPAEARTHRKGQSKAQSNAINEAAAEAAKDQPTVMIVSLGHQSVDVYRGMTLIAHSRVSTGRPGHTTKTGIFSVLQKQRYHYSNLYGAAPMPWMQRITWSGTALHGGEPVPNYPASHGCIRLPNSFALKLYGMTEVGDTVVVTRSNPKPQLIDDAKLFQPAPTPQTPDLDGHDDEQGALKPANPLILASAKMPADQAEHASLTDDPPVPSKIADTGDDADAHAVSVADSDSEATGADGAQDDTHAIAPNSDPKVDTDHAISVALPASQASKLAAAGADAAAIAAAEPRSDAPLRILITRATRRDRTMGVQYQLAALGYLKPERFDGTFGRETINAIKAFQRAHDMPPTGAFTENLVRRVYAANGKRMPPDGYLFVRRNFQALLHVPVSFKDPDKPLGAQVYTALDFTPGGKARWMVVSTNGGDPVSALNRVEIPQKVRRWISQRLTPGTSLIIANTSVDTAALRRGADFVVLTKDPGAPAVVPQPAVQQRQIVREPRGWQRRRFFQRRRRHFGPGPFWLN